MIDFLLTSYAIFAILTLTFLEIILGTETLYLSSSPFYFANPIRNFNDSQPGLQLVGLAFLIFIGFILITEAAHLLIPIFWVVLLEQLLNDIFALQLHSRYS